MIHVTSEVGRLRSVLVHEPGPEVDNMVPDMMHDLLFDDVLFGDRAREEHGIFRRVLQLFKIETVEAVGLLEETLENPEACEWLLDTVLVGLPRKVRDQLRGVLPVELVTLLTLGLRSGSGHGLFELPPLANWCFQRDPQIVLYDGVIFCAMSSAARHLESFLSRAIFNWHPRFAGTPTVHDALRPGKGSLFVDPGQPRLEGGDLVVVSKEIVAIGASERTGRSAIQSLARSLARLESAPRWLLVVALPRKRAYMHLDTVFTMVDRNACLVHPPVFLSGGTEPAEVVAIDLHSADLEPSMCGGLFEALKDRGVDLEPIPCGGEDKLAQQREQWTDGANVLALAPGVVTLYDRNVQTAQELSRRGFDVLKAEDLLLGREKVDIDNPRRLCILVPSNEISRARGGPHCLTHPLVRDDV